MHSIWRRVPYIWIVYLGCLCLVLVGMVVLTSKAIELDNANIRAFRQREEAKSRAEASRLRSELSDLINSALWRMDSVLTPLIAQESTRPFVVYQPYVSNPRSGTTKGQSDLIPSPLLKEDVGPFINIHFQVDPSNRWSSPQVPSADEIDQATEIGIGLGQIDTYRQRLDSLRDETTYAQLASASSNESVAFPSQITQMVGQVASVGRLQNGNTVEFENRDLLRLQKKSAQQEAQQSLPAVPSPAQLQVPTEPSPSSQAPIVQQPGSSQHDQTEDQNLSIRGENEWLRRNAAYEGYASNVLEQQRYVLDRDWKQAETASLGIVRAIWVNSDLLLIRSVNGSNGSIIQGCWLDWPALKKTLIDDVSDLLTSIDLVAVTPDEQVDPSRTLATLPVQLVVTSYPRTPSFKSRSRTLSFDPSVLWMSPIRFSLLVAWVCLISASGAIALLLHGVIDLSERRASFVSAVTHELRTPLTTFRMYSEMLAEGMVQDEKEVKEYLGTLRVEADRLTHLVENVLAYSRLERGKPGGRRDAWLVGQLIDRVRERLTDRATQSEMKLVIDAPDELRERTLYSDSAVIDQILFNLVENSCKYAQLADDRRIVIHFRERNQSLQIRVCDFGPGIDPSETRNLFKPFRKSAQNAAETASGVGLGLALCQRLARAINGSLQWAGHTGHQGAEFLLTIPFGTPPRVTDA